jgi:hypothetical protein
VDPEVESESHGELAACVVGVHDPLGRAGGPGAVDDVELVIITDLDFRLAT